jgi:hypothetical protein
MNFMCSLLLLRRLSAVLAVLAGDVPDVAALVAELAGAVYGALSVALPPGSFVDASALIAVGA